MVEDISPNRVWQTILFGIDLNFIKIINAFFFKRLAYFAKLKQKITDKSVVVIDFIRGTDKSEGSKTGAITFLSSEFCLKIFECAFDTLIVF